MSNIPVYYHKTTQVKCRRSLHGIRAEFAEGLDEKRHVYTLSGGGAALKLLI